MVGADQGVPGFSGTIAIGIKSEPPRWWIVDVGATACGRFAKHAPMEADAWLGVGPVEAEAIIGRVEMPEAPSVVTAGNRQLLGKFFQRYVRNLSFLDVRAGKDQ